MNVRGLQPKRHEVRELLLDRDIQIAVIAESHAKEDQDVTVSGYTWIGSEARTGASGGVGLLLQNCIANKVSTRPIKNSLIGTGRLVKAVWQDICILGVYAPNDNAGEETIRNFFQGLWNEIERELENRYIILCGDFNAKIAGYWSNTSNLGGTDLNDRRYGGTGNTQLKRGTNEKGVKGAQDNQINHRLYNCKQRTSAQTPQGHQWRINIQRPPTNLLPNRKRTWNHPLKNCWTGMKQDQVC